jgi:hypothetical protein
MKHCSDNISLTKTLNLAVLFGFFAVIPFTASAAPIPGTATSTLISPTSGLFRSPLGFHLNAGTSGWKQSEGPVDNKFIATMYKAPASKISGDAGTLTVRVDRLPKDIALDKYVQRWMKEYPKYGFDVLGSKPFAQNKDRGYVLDLINRDNGRQLRQVVFLKKQNAVILTCRDQSTTFKESLKNCNQIIRTFQWNE